MPRSLRAYLWDIEQAASDQLRWISSVVKKQKLIRKPCVPNNAAVCTALLLIFVAGISTKLGLSAAQEPTKAALIKPGVAVGQFELGATKQSVFDALPIRPNIDQTWGDDCGYNYNWVDQSHAGGGNMFFLFRDGNLSQISALTRRYHTKEAITVGDTPERVRMRYRELKAYVLLGASSEATGNRDMIYWLDQSRGIAFGFAYDQSEHRRYLWQIIVFKPRGMLCEEGVSSNSPRWHELPPYSLEPPDTTAAATPARQAY